ncbi:MAG TPA: hypothetical protein ENH82_05155 [bacterium]|nr:hypothetical protein [bacterium]
MKKKIDLKSMSVQYFIGFVVNIIFLLVLISFPTSYSNLQVPEGQYSDNYWQHSDVMSYVQPARAYLETGVFLHRSISYWTGRPDFFRTIGFPLYLATMMRLFGSNWLIWALFVQAAFYACIYPALSKIIQTLFPDNNSIIVPVFCFSLFSGAYITMMPALLTDLFFTVTFTIGLCFGLLSIARQNWKYLILYLLFVSYAAQVRPMLAHYPIVNIFVLWLIAKRHSVLSFVKVKTMIIISSAVLLLACSAPSIRNYIHHGFFKPTIIFELNLFEYLTKDVMTDRDKLVEFEQMRQKIDATDSPIEKMSLQKKFAIEACTKYPGTVIKRIMRNSLPILANNFWLSTGPYWGYHWKDMPVPDGKHFEFKKSNFLFVIFVIGCVVYMIVYLFFMYFLYNLVKEKNWLFLFTILLFVGPILVATFPGTGGGARMRLPVEGLIIICSFCGIRYLTLLKEQRQ